MQLIYKAQVQPNPEVSINKWDLFVVVSKQADEMNILALSLALVPCAIQALPLMRYVSQKQIVPFNEADFQSSLEKPYRQMLENGKKYKGKGLKDAKQNVCPNGIPGYTLIIDPIPANLAVQACLPFGQLANIADLNIIQINGLLGACGLLSAQIGSYNGFGPGANQCQYFNLGGNVDIVGGLLGCDALVGAVLCEDIGRATDLVLSTSTVFSYTATETVQTTTTTTFISGSVSVNIVSIDVTIPVTDIITEVITETILTSITVIDPVTTTQTVTTGTEIFTTTFLDFTTTCLRSTLTRTKTKYVKPTNPCGSDSCKPCTGRHCHRDSSSDSSHSSSSGNNPRGNDSSSSSSSSSSSNKAAGIEKNGERRGRPSSDDEWSSEESHDHHRRPHHPNHHHNSTIPRPHPHRQCPTSEHMNVCPCKPEPHTGMAVLRNRYTFKEAKCACEEIGMELAAVNADNFVAVSRLGHDCAGPVESAWIGSWNGDDYGGKACLVFHTGSAAGSGSINTGDCHSRRPAFCQKSKKHAHKSADFKGTCQNPKANKLAQHQTCGFDLPLLGLKVAISLGPWLDAINVCNLVGLGYVPADLNGLADLIGGFELMSECGVSAGLYINSYNNQGSNSCVFLQQIAGGLNVVHFANALLGGAAECQQPMGFLCQLLPLPIPTSSTGPITGSEVTTTVSSTVLTTVTTGLIISSVSTIVSSTTTTTTLVIPAVRTITQTISSITEVTEETVTSDFSIFTSTITQDATATSTITQAVFTTMTKTQTRVVPTTVYTTVTLLQKK